MVLGGRVADYNPLEHSIAEAHRANRELGLIFRRNLGSVQHPRGKTLSVYRQARQAMIAAYKRGGNLALASKIDVVRSLRLNMNDIIWRSLDDAIQLGIESAEKQHEYYSKAGVPLSLPVEGRADKNAMFDGWYSVVDSQMASVEAAIRSDADPSMIYGDEDGRTLGILQPAPATREGSRWLATAFSLAFLFWLLGPKDGWRPWGVVEPGEPKIQKQAIAAIDHRTTECCLRVHGQIQPLNKPFRLSGAPRYASKMDWPPFHLWCRTAIVLYMEEFDLGLTDDMKMEARRELERRSP